MDRGLTASTQASAGTAMDAATHLAYGPPPIPWSILDVMTDGYLTVDSRGAVASANEAAARLLGRDSLAGCHVRHLFADWHDASTLFESTGAERVVLRPAEDSYMSDPVEVTCAPRSDGSGCCDVLIQGAAFRTARERRLFYQATHDYLTGFYNRRMFEDHLRREVASAGRGTKLSLLLVSATGLEKSVAMRGRAATDALVLAIANVLETETAPEQHLSRIGDYEFALILRDSCTPLAVLSAERLTRAIDAALPFAVAAQGGHGQPAALPRTPGAGTPVMTATAGIAVYPDSAESARALLNAADSALCCALSHGGGHSVAPARPSFTGLATSRRLVP